MKQVKTKLCGLWEKDVNGKKLLKCHLTNEIKLAIQNSQSDMVIEIWPNGFKKEARHPDYIMYLAPAFKKEVTVDPNVKDFGPSPNFDTEEIIPF